MISGTSSVATVAQLSNTQRALALAGIILPLLALNMVEGFAIGAMPRAVAALNGFDRYSWPSTSFLLTSTISTYWVQQRLSRTRCYAAQPEACRFCWMA